MVNAAELQNSGPKSDDTDITDTVAGSTWAFVTYTTPFLTPARDIDFFSELNTYGVPEQPPPVKYTSPIRLFGPTWSTNEWPASSDMATKGKENESRPAKSPIFFSVESTTTRPPP